MGVCGLVLSTDSVRAGAMPSAADQSKKTGSMKSEIPRQHSFEVVHF